MRIFIAFVLIMAAMKIAQATEIVDTGNKIWAVTYQGDVFEMEQLVSEDDIEIIA